MNVVSISKDVFISFCYVLQLLSWAGPSLFSFVASVWLFCTPLVLSPILYEPEKRIQQRKHQVRDCWFKRKDKFTIPNHDACPYLSRINVDGRWVISFQIGSHETFFGSLVSSVVKIQLWQMSKNVLTCFLRSSLDDMRILYQLLEVLCGCGRHGGDDVDWCSKYCKYQCNAKKQKENEWKK
jgi:hypothetical protein